MALYSEDRDVTFEIIEEIGIISTLDTGWTKEINIIRWNGGVAKYDIREWDPLHERMSRGITLKEDEMRRILELMRRRRTYARNRRRAPASEETASGAEEDLTYGASELMAAQTQHVAEASADIQESQG